VESSGRLLLPLDMASFVTPFTNNERSSGDCDAIAILVKHFVITLDRFRSTSLMEANESAARLGRLARGFPEKRRPLPPEHSACGLEVAGDDHLNIGLFE